MDTLNQRINERSLAKTPLTDKSLVKGKDLDLLRQVTNYLDGFGLKYEIRGSAKKNAKRGLPRTYRDLDILVRKEERDKAYPAIMTLSRIAAEKDFSRIKDLIGLPAPIFGTYITHETLLHQMYVSCYVDHRFKIERESPKTKIDLCFEGTKIRPYIGFSQKFKAEVDKN